MEEALPSLGNLNLGGNLFTGFSESGFGSNNLKYLDISRNKLEGRIPDGVGRMLNLQTLDLSWNTLTGPIPSGLGNVLNLDLSLNMLSGNIPQDIRNDAYRCSKVDLSANQLNGSIPTRLISVQCSSLNLSGNFLVGNIPEVTPVGAYLVALDLSDNLLDGPFPVSILNSFLHLRLGRNRLSGDFIEHLTMVLTSHSWRTRIWLEIRVQGNQFTGDIGTLLPALRASNGYKHTLLQVLDLSYNSMNMTLPTAQDSNPLQIMLQDPHMDDLAELRLAGNNLMGISLPQTLSRSLPSLGILDLSDSFLEGEMTDEFFTSLGNLTQFSVAMNRLSGGIPAMLPLGLQVLDLRGNRFSGEIPAELLRLSDLTFFDVSNNSLSGPIPSGVPLNVHNPSSPPLSISISNLGNLTHFSVFMNRLSGGIPEKLPGGLQVLEIGDNNFHGEIPDGIFTGLPSLLVFNASNDWLGGRIPATLPLAIGLQVLDLSGNNFSGEIPAAIFFSLPNLTTFDVSNNSLSGRIPHGLPLNVFNKSSFANNPGLCGGPLPDCPLERGQRRLRVWVLVTFVLALAFLVSVASCLLLAWKWRRYSKTHEQDADLIAIVLKRALAVTLMPLRDLQRATNFFSESSRIGEGGGGTVYRGELKDGTNVAIKTCKHREGGEGFAADKQQFLNEVEILSRVHHRNLVKLLGCSMESNKAALVFQYIPNVTLEEHLRGRREGALSWKQRLLIAVQTSDALAYLHSAADPPIFHTDVNPSNILLDEDLSAKVADFGISKLAPMGTTHLSTMGVQGTIGYMDPEYLHTFQLTAKSDVYSFGVVLLEIISGKSPRDILWASGEKSLVELVISVMRKGSWEHLIDPCLVDLFNTLTGKASILSTCALAAQCLAKTSPERPGMKEVWKQLQTLCVQYKASLHYVTNLPPDIEVPEGAENYSSDDRSSLLDLDDGNVLTVEISLGAQAHQSLSSRWSNLQNLIRGNESPSIPPLWIM